MEPETTAALATKSDEELLAIWVTNDRQQWHGDTFEAIRVILIARGIAPPAQSEHAPSSDPPLSTMWLTIYTLVRLPLCALLWLAPLVQLPTTPWPFLWGIPWAALYLGLAVGLHRRRAAAWRLNWFLLSVETVGVMIGAIRESTAAPKRFLLAMALWIGVWIIPNVIYFRKRRGLFADVELVQQAIGERDP